MKRLFSRKGFTLIELLVVIGILAVLAAIAIPSVAGVIDRANKSADNTNANEYTNAMERFASEYELYKQDIASGIIKDTDGDSIPDNMSAAQSRVYNVTGATTIEDIRLLEGPIGFNGVKVDIENKYALNSKTAQTIIENYTKTSSATFEPKQTDMTYWYHTKTGYTVVASAKATVDELLQLVPVEIRDNNINPAYWIDLSTQAETVNIDVVNVTYWDCNRTWDEIVYEFEMPNPKFCDVDFSKIHFIIKDGADSELTMETATKIMTLQNAFENIEDYMQKENGEILYFAHGHPLKKSQNLKDLVVQACFAYEYEENGEVKYSYSPIYATSCNELIAQGKIYDVTDFE